MNKSLNARLKYESLDNVSVLEQATHSRKDVAALEVMMNATKNGGKLLQEIQQGHGKMKHNACLCFKTNMRSEAQEWITSTHGKTFKIKNKYCCETTVTMQIKAGKERGNESHDFIIDRLKVVQIDTSKHGCVEVSNKEEMSNKKRHKKIEKKHLKNHQTMKRSRLLARVEDQRCHFKVRTHQLVATA